MENLAKKMTFGLVAGLISVAAHAGDAAKGAELVKAKACISCHGEGLNKPIDASYPKLAGQHEDYIVHALTAYKNSDNVAYGRNNAIMGSQAKGLGEQDIRDIAAYVSSLKGDLILKK